MGERKVLNKYIPPDFDPAAVPRRKMPKNQQIVVRMMLPMSIQCNTCGNFLYKGTKFNCRKEDVPEDTYLGIRVFRFYFKCTRCSAELAMKTDPKNSDYVMEAGASRNFEPWRDKSQQQDIATAKQEAEEAGDAMKSLENRTKESKREMDILAALDEMKSLSSRHATVTYDQALQAITRRKEQEEEASGSGEVDKLTEEDEAIVKKIFHGQVRRLDDADDDGGASKRPRVEVNGAGATSLLAADGAEGNGKAPVKPNKKPDPVDNVTFGIKPRAPKFAVKAKAAAKEESVGLSLLGAYGSSDDSD